MRKQSSYACRCKEKTSTSKIGAIRRLNRLRVRTRASKGLGKRFLEDQEQIWTSPAKIHFGYSVACAGQWYYSGALRHRSRFQQAPLAKSATISHYKTLSNAESEPDRGAGGCGCWSVRHNEHWRRDGISAGEAAIIVSWLWKP